MPRGGLSLFLGPDRPRKLQRIHELERELGIQPFDRHQLDAGTIAAGELLLLCRQQPAASPLRLIVVDQAHRLDRTTVEGLLQHAEAIAATACVVLLVEVELSARHALAQLTLATEPGHPRSGSATGVSRDTVHRPTEAGTPPVAGSQTEQFPERHATASKPFAFTDALGSRDAAGALSALRDQLAAGKEPLEVLGLVGWQLNRWVTVRRLLDLGYSEERIVSATGWRPWQVQRLRSEIARRPLDSIQRLLTRCWQLDVDAKRGRAMPELAVEQLVVELCGERASAAARD